MPVIKWRLEDPADTNPLTRSYTFQVNPNEMSSPFGRRAISTLATTAVDGQVLMWEGRREPATMTISGTILHAAQHEALRSWVYDRRGRLFLWDHFGRRMTVVLQQFDARAQKTRPGRYWLHQYTITALVVDVARPLHTSDEGVS